MTDFRRLQRTLFRMQMDSGFAAGVLAGDALAIATTGLAADDLALLQRLDPVAIEADADGRRRLQVLGNASLEYRLFLACCAQPQKVLDGFAVSKELHLALRQDLPLPLAFGRYAAGAALDEADPAAAPVARLEAGLAEARRRRWQRPPPPPQHVILAPHVSLLSLPEGTLDHASALHLQMSEGGARPHWNDPGKMRENLLVEVKAKDNPYALPSAQPEVLSAPVADLLVAAEQPLPCAGFADIARRHGADPASLADFVNSLVADEILVRG